MKLGAEPTAVLENDAASDPMAREVSRIEAAYASRHNHAIYSFFEPSYRLLVQEREDKLLQALSQQGFSKLENTKILEVGCGTGAWLRSFIRWGAQPENLLGVDLLPSKIAEARRLCPAGVTLKSQNSTNLEVTDGSFDLVLQATVFTSILDAEMKRLLAQEMLRVVRDKGLIIWYDFHANNPSNPDVRGIKESEIKRLFPNCNVSLQNLTLAPPIGRRVAPVSTSLYKTLSLVKPLCTHYLGIITKL
ncbi:MAG TPA: class I SAM-dependent methyltransferase [Nitrososphaera sp.]|nr:class I SAM-dependent methyltransferase [Nitrososphaera sp.]